MTSKNKNIGLFFGSFNPIHIGHLAIANYIVEFTELDQIWFVVSPHNPLKNKASLLEDYHRLELVNLAIGDCGKFKASNIEFRLPQPSYTINTLEYLKEKYPKMKFSLIMGADSLKSINKWKNPELILTNYIIYVYPRPNIDISEFQNNTNLKMVDAPIMEISSSFIRESIKNKKDIAFFMPEKVYKYIQEMHFYEK
ncbi:MAG: nicotinic acid mononucleotide adenylyltransferase [Bacteroidetes bacterium GWA2_31_9]|nr:MAG: nicotinic acid mononucleotide adenylyltransferase [Bacteroidetes bacterium GWA2_31_9]